MNGSSDRRHKNKVHNGDGRVQITKTRKALFGKPVLAIQQFFDITRVVPLFPADLTRDDLPQPALERFD